MTDSETKAIEAMAEHLAAFADNLSFHTPSIALLPAYCDGETAIEIDDGIAVFPADTTDGRRWMVTEMVVDHGSHDAPPIISYVERGDFPTLIQAVRHALHLWVDCQLEEAGELGGDEQEGGPT